MQNFHLCAVLTALGLAISQTAGAATQVQDGASATLAPSELASIGTVDERYQSYNVEMLEVTGGEFWKPYPQTAHPGAGAGAPSGTTNDLPLEKDNSLRAYHPPIQLDSKRLRTLAAALGPAYVRVSGTAANGVYLADSDTPLKSPPPGFESVLTRARWQAVIDFAHAVDAQIVTSFAISAGTRDANGVWTPTQAQRFFDYTRSIGGRIAAAEFMNEPTLPTIGYAPAGYNAADYARDFKVFHDFVRQYAPDMRIAGPGAVGELSEELGPSVMDAIPGVIRTPALLAATGPNQVDIFSYHHYGAESLRCAGKGMPQTTADDALSEAWLATTDQTLDYYRKLRDQYDPGKPLWITEVADTACGGNPWASTFIDTFRYLDQLGRLARQHVQVIMHNTLAASDYGLLDHKTLEPRPNYWGAWLWRTFMGTTVLDTRIPIQEGLHAYAHCLRNTPGGVAVLAINNDKTRAGTLAIQGAASRYTLSAPELLSRQVQLNGTTLALGEGDALLPTLSGEHVGPGKISLAPATITFLTFEKAGNKACR
ncbi:MAG: hypothetical protein L0H54_05715 [Alcaligenaceae bacterium]|nr:hypothetical protein [Alcaligenaceae bacterium]